MVRSSRIPISTDLSQGLCFGCGKHNPFGLKLRFKWDGSTAKAEFKPHEHYQGWPGIIHGGIITCILDEAMSYATHFKGLHCVTAKMQIRFKCPALVDDLLIITSSIIKEAKKLVETKASISLPDGTLVAESVGTQYVLEVAQNAKEAKSPENV